MICSIPDEIEQRLAARAAERQTTTHELVIEALSWYLQTHQAVHVEAPSRESPLQTFYQLQQAAGITAETASHWKEAIQQARR